MMPIVATNRKPALSWSALSQYSRCPRAYFFQRVARIPTGPKASALLEGTCGHAALQWFYARKRDNCVESLSEVLEFFDSYWDSAVQLEEAKWDVGLPTVRKRAVSKAVEAHYKIIAPRIDPHLIEHEWRIELPECSFDLAGVCDVIGAGGEVYDHKFYNRLPRENDVHSDGQLTVYALARAAGAFGHFDNHFEVPLHIAAAVKGTMTAALMSTLRDEKALIWFRRAIVDWAKAIDAGVFPPNTNGWWHSPKWCDYWEHCNE